MIQTKIIACAIAATLTSCSVLADNDHHQGPFSFEAIAGSAYTTPWNPIAPWIIPEGFTQSVVSDESDLNIYDNGRDDWHDMNVVNETGKQAGRFMYRTHEVRAGSTYVEGGAVSVVDLKTGKARAAAIRDAVQRVLNDPTYRQAAQTLAPALARHDAPGRLASLLTALLPGAQAHP